MSIRYRYTTIIRDLQKFHPKSSGFLAIDEIDELNDILRIKDMDDQELCNLRDFMVCYYSDLAEGYRNTEYDMFDAIWDKMSAITCVIDMRLQEYEEKEPAIGFFGYLMSEEDVQQVVGKEAEKTEYQKNTLDKVSRNIRTTNERGKGHEK